jgi:miniconductance mechanosensitive channel
MEPIREWLDALGPTPSFWLAVGVRTAALVLLAILANFIVRRILLRAVEVFAKATKAKWDDAFIHHWVFQKLAQLAPAVVVHVGAPAAFAGLGPVISTVETLAFVYMAVIVLATTNSVLNAVLEIYESTPFSRTYPLKPVVQVLKILAFFAGTIIVLSTLLGRSPVVFLSGLGAFTAVLLLVFKDPILGLAAGIQLTANDLVRKGDWITVPKFGADGDVVDVSLTTVSVQNWDKTISTIPTYALLTDTFKNWRGMQASGGRRIKRAIHIDMTSIRFCDAEMLERFKKIQYIQDYLARRLEEVQRWNQERDVDESSLINGRRLTNVGTFRAYLEAYLRNHPMVHQDMTFLVRHLQLGAQGLPIEIYVFSTDQRWTNYEAIQADIFDHVLAIIPLFDLRVFQEPSGADLRAIGEAKRGAA